MSKQTHTLDINSKIRTYKVFTISIVAVHDCIRTKAS